MMRPIYLDHNATTPLLPEAGDAMRRVEAEAFGNPSSAHSAGRKARQALEDAREHIAALVGAQADELTFTSGATEANNLVVLGLVCEALLPRAASGEAGVPRIPRLVASHLEHPCVIEPLRQLEARGIAVDWWPVDSRGRVVAGVCDPGPASQRPATAGPASVRPATGGLVCLMLANHETGAIQPVREVATSLPPGVALHCDATQAVGKIPVNFRELGATTLTASAHKFGGPKGIGILLASRSAAIVPRMFGGHQQQGRRPGTEPVALAVGMAAALDHMTRHMNVNRAKLEALRARLWERLQEVASPVVLNGPEIGAPDVVPTTLNVSFPGCRAELLLMALDLAGVACSTGSACSSGSLLPSAVLRAMGLPDENLKSALRFSFSAGVEFADIDEAADRTGSAVRTARKTGV